ncbi:hypothetical protein PIB30_086644 [Stylosanthes scabra]|uniref:DUF4283 domain-containing protein n=1 Tax=Stylosanthes scabra TaxID=79078 RepID=A0ABU6US04_9FABA|nr:hypothetical protein [Stylosanthes scabra]
MNLLLEKWDGPGDIEVRDVGPYRCLITFSNPEIRDKAINNDLLLSVFDEVRFHWNMLWSLSRRVWIEVTEMPIPLWCKENFTKVAELWGKDLVIDDRTEEAKSFSIGRMQIDCFHWEMINEWVSLKVDEERFEVHVREIGAEAYSVEAHPNRETVCSSDSVSAECIGGGRKSMESPVEHAPSKDGNGGCVDGTNVPINVGSRIDGLPNSENDPSVVIRGPQHECGHERVIGGYPEATYEATCLDPISLAAQTANTKCNSGPCTEYGNMNGLKGVTIELSGENDTQSSSSCPYPPGFGPCESGNHNHDTIRAPISSEFVRETPCGEGVGENQKISADKAAMSSPHETHGVGEELRRARINVDDAIVEDDAPPLAKHSVSSEEVGRSGERTSTEEFAKDSGGDPSEGAAGNHSLGGNQSDSVDSGSREAESGETLYLINREVEVGEWKDLDDSGLAATGLQEGSEIEESWDNEEVIEAYESKKLWDRSGLFIDSSEEEQVLDKLADRKSEKQKQKKQNQGRRIPCLQGRTLATRKLMSGNRNTFR